MKKAFSSKMKNLKWKNEELNPKWVSNHFLGRKELKMVICWIRSKRSLNLLNSKAVSTKTFEQVKLYFSIDRLFDSSFTVLASIELLTFRGVSAWISLQDVRIASQSGWWMRTASHPQRAFACGCSKGSQKGWGQGRLASTSRLSLLLCP